MNIMKTHDSNIRLRSQEKVANRLHQYFIVLPNRICKNYTNQLNLRTVKTIFIYVGSKINYTLPFFFSLNAFFHVNKGTSQALVLGTRKWEIG